MRALCYAQTNIGSGRDNNEDNYYCNGTFKRDAAVPVAEAAAEQEGKRQEEQAKRDEQAAKVKEAQSLLNEIKADAAKVNELLDQEHEAEAKVDAEIRRKQQPFRVRKPPAD